MCILFIILAQLTLLLFMNSSTTMSMQLVTLECELK